MRFFVLAALAISTCWRPWLSTALTQMPWSVPGASTAPVASGRMVLSCIVVTAIEGRAAFDID